MSLFDIHILWILFELFCSPLLYIPVSLNMFISLVLSMMFYHITQGDIPENFQISLQREAGSGSLVFTGGNFRRGLDGVEFPVVRATVVSQTGHVDPARLGEQFLTLTGPDDVRVTLDVTGMTVYEALSELASIPQGVRFSINFGAAFTRNVDSIAYISSADGNESLILRPTDISDLVAFGGVLYTQVHENEYVFASTLLGSH